MFLGRTKNETYITKFVVRHTAFQTQSREESLTLPGGRGRRKTLTDDDASGYRECWFPGRVILPHLRREHTSNEPRLSSDTSRFVATAGGYCPIYLRLLATTLRSINNRIEGREKLESLPRSPTPSSLLLSFFHFFSPSLLSYSRLESPTRVTANLAPGKTRFCESDLRTKCLSLHSSAVSLFL